MVLCKYLKMDEETKREFEKVWNEMNKLKKEQIISNETISNEKKLSVGEFVQEMNPKDDVQRTAVFAYFLEIYENKTEFNSDEIKSCFRKARETVPANVNDKINQCIKKRWISEEDKLKDNKKSFYLTSTGKGIVEKKFSHLQDE